MANTPFYAIPFSGILHAAILVDNVTHTLIGLGLARAGLAQRFGRGTTMILAVTSNLPDIDAACLPFGPLGFLWRRTFSHCLPGGVLLVLAATLLFRWRYPQLSFKTVLGLTSLGIAGHVFADLWNSYGVLLYWPFSARRVSCDWVFILDLAIWAILGLSLLAARLFRRHESWFSRGGLCLVAAYLGLCIIASCESRKLLSAQPVPDGAASPAFYLYPEPFGPGRFRGVARATHNYAIYQIWPFQKRVEILERLDIEEQNPMVAAARRSETGRRLDSFFSTPVWRLAADEQVAIVYGLGFRSKLFPARVPFVFRVAPDGDVRRAHFPYLLNPPMQP